jgi:hypothetical protein
MNHRARWAGLPKPVQTKKSHANVPLINVHVYLVLAGITNRNLKGLSSEN